ncbi:MAG: 2-vinyl bacteriochlorophyllide hydratase [Pseudomonadota bacterium]
MQGDVLTSAQPSTADQHSGGGRHGLYTPAQRVRRDETVWTVVQGVLAPIQFFVCAVSIGLIVRYLATGEGLFAAHVSVLAKTAILYLIMVTGAIWEKIVFGQYLFAPAFYWEDMVSMAVLALHTIYLIALFGEVLSPVALMLLALAAYGAYIFNAIQFILKLRAARLQGPAASHQAGHEVVA